MPALPWAPRRLLRPAAVIESFTAFGLRSIFLRPVNYQGFARKRYAAKDTTAAWNAYHSAFVDALIEYNWTAAEPVEEYYFVHCLRRVLRSGHNGHVDLRNPNILGHSYLVVDYDGTFYIGERLDDQIAQEERRARPHETDERRQLEMHLPGDRRKDFVISIDTAHVRSADPNSARSFELVVARCGRGGRGEPGGRYFVTSTDRTAIRDCALHALRSEGYRGFGDVTVISDGAEILKRLPRAMPKPTAHIIDLVTSP